MAPEKDIIEQITDRIIALGPYLFMAACRSEESVMKVLGELPYVTLDQTGWSVRKGTEAQAVGNMILDDGSVGFSVITGGALTEDEARSAIAVLNEYAESQTYAGPGLDELFEGGK